MKNESVDAKWNMFQYRLTGIMDSCIPHKFTTSRHNLPWFNRSLRRQTRLKQRLYNRAKKSGRQSHWNKFKLVRKQLLKNLNRTRNDYLSADLLGDSIKQNPKAFLVSYQKARELRRTQTTKMSKLEMKCLPNRELRPKC